MKELKDLVLIYKQVFYIMKYYLKKVTSQLLKTLKRKNVYSNFKDNVWGVDLADMQLISI